jgi:hypothetical protein
MQYSKGQLSTMAKKICKVNDALHNAISYCEEISHDEDIRELLNNKELYHEEYLLLIERISKFSKMQCGADAKIYGRDLDDATDLLSIAYEDFE